MHQEVDTEGNDGLSYVYPVFVTPTTALADRHALMVDFITIRQARMPQSRKYRIKVMSTDARGKNDAEIKNKPKNTQLIDRMQ